MIWQKMSKLSGCVEFISLSGQIAGWARSFDARQDISIQVFLDGKQIGSTIPDVERQELGGTYGYKLNCDVSFEISQILGDSLLIQVVALDGTYQQLNYTPHARATCVLNFTRGVLKSLSPLERHFFLQPLLQANPDILIEPILSKTTLEDVIKKRSAKRSSPVPGISETFSTINVPIGHVSDDGSVMVGRDGYLFLIDGSNGALDLQLKNIDGNFVKGVSKGWLDLFLARIEFCRSESIKFTQLIFPEKLSVLSEYFPLAIPGISPLLQSIETGVAKRNDLKDFYLSCFDLFTDLPFPLKAQTYLRTDSHLSLYANYLVYTRLLAQIGLTSPFSPLLSEFETVTGDLAKRVFNVALFENQAALSDDFIKQCSRSVLLIENVTPAKGHIGIRRVWKNDAAPYPHRVIVYGNSFFERAGDPRCLSWWFSRTFAEFHFVWAPNLDRDYISRHSPDWVICQTIERFLASVPKS